MATRNFNPFPSGFRLISGDALNALFTGITQIPALAVTLLTVATYAVTTAVITTLTATTAAITTLTGTTFTATGNVTSSAGYVHGSVATALTAVGTNRATALQLAKQTNIITTSTASTGVILPAVSTVGAGALVYVFNAGASPVQVYGSGSDTIDGTAAATGVPLTNALRCVYIATAAATWISAQLGVISA